MKSAASGTILLLLFIIDLATSKIFVSMTTAQKEEHQSFFVLCRDPDEGSKVQWRNPKNRIISNKSGNNVVKIDTKHGSQLRFNNVRKEDEGIYVCKSNTDQAEFQLFVTEPASQDNEDNIDIPHNQYPTNKPFHIHSTVSTSFVTFTPFTTQDPIDFVDTPRHVKGKQGTDILLRCEARNAETEILVDGNKPLNGTKYKVLGDGLVIVNATPDDSEHQYICRAFNLEKGAFKTLEITVTVIHPPIPLFENQDVIYGYLGGTVNLTCEVKAEPVPNFKWFRNGKRKIIGQKVHLSNPKTSVITIYLASPKDFGEYKCEASNTEGTHVTSFTLEMGSRPPPPEFLEIRDANSTSLSIYIEPPINVDKEEPTGFLVEYRPVDEPYWDSRTFPNIAEDKIYVLTNLTKNTTYQVRAATLNRAGPSLYTNETEYTTSSAIVFASVPTFCILCVALFLITSETASFRKLI